MKLYRRLLENHPLANIAFLVVLLVGTSHFIQQVFTALFLTNCVEISEYIRTGKLDFMLLLPINTRFIVSFRKVDLGGFVNADSERKNFLPNLKPKGFAALPNRTPPTFVLTVPAIGPAGEFNTWNYRSTRPENNTESFDLWAEVILGSKTNKISNWKE